MHEVLMETQHGSLDIGAPQKILDFGSGKELDYARNRAGIGAKRTKL
jgi:hypothetical protein